MPYAYTIIGLKVFNNEIEITKQIPLTRICLCIGNNIDEYKFCPFCGNENKIKYKEITHIPSKIKYNFNTWFIIPFNDIYSFICLYMNRQGTLSSEDMLSVGKIRLDSDELLIKEGVFRGSLIEKGLWNEENYGLYTIFSGYELKK
jgi:hypothetical protein